MFKTSNDLFIKRAFYKLDNVVQKAITFIQKEFDKKEILMQGYIKISTEIEKFEQQTNIKIRNEEIITDILSGTDIISDIEDFYKLLGFRTYRDNSKNYLMISIVEG